ncbi:cupin domain-containing protein [Bacillus sp. 2205SS5-2]|uniref:cupin domain-containing protein n=1 Tax=Bacillus sp. 2205SS5-2 TaxID=3109031 RepID=UPI00300444D1
MYNPPNDHSNQYYVHQTVNSPDQLTRNNEGNHQQEIEVLQNSINGKVTAFDLYHRLAKVAPVHHKKEIFQMAEDDQRHWWQLSQLYTSLTGSQPAYQAERVPFQSYQEGLERGYETRIAGYEQLRIGSLQTRNSSVYDVLVHACKDEWKHAKRLNELGWDAPDRMDYGPNPFTVNIDDATVQNNTFRTAIWTGKHLQVTLMSILPGEDIGLEIHPELDQFLRLEQGKGVVRMGDEQDQLNYEREVEEDFAIVIPAGKWHNLINTGTIPIKLYSIYAPPQHPRGTVHVTKADALAAEA